MENEPQYGQFKKKKSPQLKRLRHASEYAALMAFKKLASLGSLQTNQNLGKRFGSLAYRLAKKDRGIAEYQLEFCYPERSPQERSNMVKETFQNLGRTLFEVLIIEKFRKNRDQWIQFMNREAVEKAVANGKGTVFLFAHVGNWELIPIIYDMLGVHGIIIHGVVGTEKLDAVLASTRQASNLETFNRKNPKSASAMLKCFRSNGFLLFGIDQDIHVQSVFVDFFGRKASTAKGAATLAQRYGASVVSALGHRQEDGTHQYHFQLLSEGPYQGGEEEVEQLTQHYTSAVEQHIRKYPTQWVWIHRRWKTRPPQENES